MAAMEMSVDVTQRKLLEEELKKSEKKYYAIFDNIPNPVFVLDMNTLEILDCNHSVKAVYGYDKDEIIRSSFLNFFKEKDGERFASLIKTSTVIDRAQHINKAGQTLFVNHPDITLRIPGGQRASGDDQRYYQTARNRTAINPGQQNGNLGRDGHRCGP